jgi:hypothetical protein
MIGKDTLKLTPSFSGKMRIQQVFSRGVELIGKKHAATPFSVDWNSHASLSKRRDLEPAQQYSLSQHIESHLGIPHDVAWEFVDEGKFCKFDIHIACGHLLNVITSIACGKRKTQGDTDCIAEQTMDFNMLKLLQDSRSLLFAI